MATDKGSSMSICEMTYGNSSFLVRDLDMQLMFFYIHEEMLDGRYFFAGKEAFLSRLDFYAKGYAFGEPHLGWSRFLTTGRESETMIVLLGNLIVRLHSKGPEISREEIEAIPVDDFHFKMYLDNPFPVSRLIRIAEALIRMISGSWNQEMNRMLLLPD